MDQPPLLPEISEADSAGEVAELYEEIRRTLGIPFVGLIYRTLAVVPGRLAAVWQRLGPLLGHPATWAAAAALDPGLEQAPALVPARDLQTVGFGAEFAGPTTATLVAYDRMNRLNLIGLSALLEPDRPSAAASPEVWPPGAGTRWQRGELLPMPALAALPAAERALLIEIAETLLPGQRPVLVPSLLRHFARPGVLPALWQSLRPAVAGGFVPGAAEGLRRQAAGLPFPASVSIEPLADAGALEIARSFVYATSTMVVLGALLGRALGSRTTG